MIATFAQLNSDLNSTMKIFNYSSQEFDFNNPDYPAGIYRLGAEQYLINQPGITMAFSVLLIIKENTTDTLSMVGFPYDNNGIIIFRQANKAQWSTKSWFKLEGVAI